MACELCGLGKPKLSLTNSCAECAAPLLSPCSLWPGLALSPPSSRCCSCPGTHSTHCDMSEMQIKPTNQPSARAGSRESGWDQIKLNQIRREVQWFAIHNSPEHHPGAAGRTWIALSTGLTCWDGAHQTAQLSFPLQTTRVLQTEGAEVPISSKKISQH